MRIEEIVVSDDTPATPVADGQGTAAGTGAPEPTGAEPIDKEMEVPITESELNKDLEVVEGEYGPPAGLIETAGEAHEEARDTEADAHDTILELESYFLITKSAIENKTCSMESLELIRKAVQPYLKEGKFVTMAMEGREGASIELQHQLVLEGIKESIKSALHSVHTAHSASIDNIKMIFTSIDSDVKRYEAGLKKAVEKFDEFIKANPKAELHLDLQILQNFFNLDPRHTDKLTTFMKTDLDFDTYILTKFAPACEDQLEKLATIIGGEKTFAGIRDKVQKLKHPIEMFDKRLLGDARNTPALGGYYAYIYQVSSAIQGFSEGKYEKMSRLEQLGSSARIVIRQAEGNVHRAAPHFIAEGALSPVLKVTPQQVKQIAEMGAGYLKNIEFFLQVLKNTSKTHDVAFEKYLKFESEDINYDQADEIFEYLGNLEKGITSTCRQEVTRALKAVFYSIALVNRATFVNK
jgi:hypothetical protein